MAPDRMQKTLCIAKRHLLQWIDTEFGWSRKTADRLIDVGRASFEVANLASLNVPISGLYLLTAPETPAEVIEIAAER
jgi:hypothetical protein